MHARGNANSKHPEAFASLFEGTIAAESQRLWAANFELGVLVVAVLVARRQFDAVGKTLKVSSHSNAALHPFVSVNVR